MKVPASSCMCISDISATANAAVDTRVQHSSSSGQEEEEGGSGNDGLELFRAANQRISESVTVNASKGAPAPAAPAPLRKATIEVKSGTLGRLPTFAAMGAVGQPRSYRPAEARCQEPKDDDTSVMSTRS
mmetsp:Transcript_101986/g.292649  ORF Transcript_101986/g.292649 Transcript_101986/m.292649 type:complete len:130 (+) Transcript_101986:2036-2425(+)